MFRTLLVALIVLSVGKSTAIRAKFKKLDVEYVAKEYTIAGEPLAYRLDENLVEDIAVDIRKQLIYALGENRLTVFKILRNKTLQFLHTETFAEQFRLSTIQTCKNFVTIAARDINQEKGRLFVFRGYSKALGGDLARINFITVGKRPEHHVVTRNCKKIVVALEADGKIAVVHFRDSLLGDPTVLILSFSAFADEQERLQNEWFILDASAQEFDMLMDPEWVCLNKKETRAYVSMGTNNGIAVVDLRPGREHIRRLRGLGLKSWAENGGTQGFDGSTRPEPKAELKNAPIFSAYNPFQISCHTINKKDVVFIAGKGSGVTEKLSNLELEDDLPQELLQSEEFGDLQVLHPGPQTDPDMNDKLNKIVATGSRSFAAVSGKTLEVIADTGSTIELHTMNSVLFNADASDDSTLLDSFDKQSIFQGPEPEIVITKQICRGRYIVMVGGIEHPGIVFVYTLDTHSLGDGFVFQDQIDGYVRKDSLFVDEHLYRMRLLSLRKPRGLRFGRTVGDRITVVSGSEFTGSVELFELHIDCKASPQKKDIFQ